MPPEELAKFMQLPKHLWEGSVVAFNPEFFTIGVAVGNTMTAYAMTPENAKRFAKQITDATIDFENKHRKIQDIASQFPSPMRPEDLKNPPQK